MKKLLLEAPITKISTYGKTWAEDTNLQRISTTIVRTLQNFFPFRAQRSIDSFDIPIA